MFLQNYMYQAANAFVLAYTQPDKLLGKGNGATEVDWSAINYGMLEFKARARRYLHFAMPCMVSDLWARGLKKDRPTFEQVTKKTSALALYLNKVCYVSRDLGIADKAEHNVIDAMYNTAPISQQEATELCKLLMPPKLSTASTRNIPFYDDEHGYVFYKDNTPYDASHNLLMTMVSGRLEGDKTRGVVLPNVQTLFLHDDYFVIDRFAEMPNDCLGPSQDASMMKKMQLMVGPECVRDVAYASIKDLREMDLWHPTEFDQLILVDGTTVGGTLKSMFTGITALTALYWSWVEAVARLNAPASTAEWIHRDLCNRIEANEVHTISLDKDTAHWLTEAGIATVLPRNTDEYFTFPTYDRNRYFSRTVDERRLSFEEWAWHPDHAKRVPRNLGVKLVGKPHGRYDISMERIYHGSHEHNFQDKRPHEHQHSAPPTRIPNKMQEFLDWSHGVAAAPDKLFELLDKLGVGTPPEPKAVSGFKPPEPPPPPQHRPDPKQPSSYARSRPATRTPEPQAPKKPVTPVKGVAPKQMDLGFTPPKSTAPPKLKEPPKAPDKPKGNSDVKPMNLF